MIEEDGKCKAEAEARGLPGEETGGGGGKKKKTTKIGGVRREVHNVILVSDFLSSLFLNPCTEHMQC